MDGIIKIAKWNNKKIFIRNRYSHWFSDTWHLINLERSYHIGRIEYKFCLFGFELVLLVRKN